jgi:hypothetical protein
LTPCLQLYHASCIPQKLEDNFDFEDQKERLAEKLNRFADLELELIIAEQEIFKALILRKFGDQSADEYFLT